VVLSHQASRLPKSVKKETAPIRSTKRCGEELIKTLLKKIVHNKNDIFAASTAIQGFAVNLKLNHTSSGPSIP
jgi:hypothetical protein